MPRKTPPIELLALATVYVTLGANGLISLFTKSPHLPTHAFWGMATLAAVVFLAGLTQCAAMRWRRAALASAATAAIIALASIWLAVDLVIDRRAPSSEGILALLFVGLFAAVAYRNWTWAARPCPAPPERRCPACGYDLRATPDPQGPRLPRCPECGTPACYPDDLP